MLALWWMAKTPTTNCRLDLGPIKYHDQFAFPKYIPKKLWSPLRIEGGQRYQLQLLDAVAARMPSGFSHGEGVSGNIGTGISSHPIILNKKLVTSIWQVALADIAVKFHLVNSEDPMSFEAQAHSSARIFFFLCMQHSIHAARRGRKQKEISTEACPPTWWAGQQEPNSLSSGLSVNGSLSISHAIDVSSEFEASQDEGTQEPHWVKVWGLDHWSSSLD